MKQVTCGPSERLKKGTSPSVKRSDIKKMQVEVEMLRKKANLTGWNKEKEHASVWRRCVAQRTMQIAAHRYVSVIAL
jgi:hypothetical protein